MKKAGKSEKEKGWDAAGRTGDGVRNGGRVLTVTMSINKKIYHAISTTKSLNSKKYKY